MTNEDRRIPHDIDAEKIVLGACLMSRRAVEQVADMGLEPAHFYRPAHATIYDTARGLVDAGKPVDATSVNAELVKRGQSVAAGGTLYLVELVESVPSVANAGYYADIVIAQARLRRGLQAALRAAQICSEGRGEVDDLLDAVASEMQAATMPTHGDDSFTSLGDLMPGVIDTLERDPADTDRVSLPYKDLDALLNGAEPGELIVVAGRPGMGKTTLGMDAARKTAIRHQLPVAVFSLEMSAPELATRILCAEAQVGLGRLQRRELSEDDWERVRAANGRMGEAPLMIDDSPRVTVQHIRARLRGMARTDPARLVVIDYLQLMSSPGRVESRQQEVSDISRGLKLIAKEFGVPVILAAQLNRGPEMRHDKKPVVADLRESGSIEQDADVVVLLYREDVYETDSPRSGEQDLIVGKHRAGPTATVTVAFQGHYCRAVDMAAG